MKLFSRHSTVPPHRAIVVVDMRTLRLAERTIGQARAQGDWARVLAGATAAIIWLRYERHYGRQTRRIRLAGALEVMELHQAQAREQLGLG